jgi:hypothetical protein
MYKFTTINNPAREKCSAQLRASFAQEMRKLQVKSWPHSAARQKHKHAHGYGNGSYRYIFSRMNIHLPAILMFTRYQGFDP